MRLKRLTLHGFKTFADRTEIEFAPGVTAVVGPNGSGKCVTGDTLVTLSDGRDAPIRDLVEAALDHAPAVETLDDGLLTRQNPHAVCVVSLNLRTLRLEPRPVAAFVKRSAPATLLRVTTRSGRTITATPYHPLFTLRDGRPHALRADELAPGVRVAVPRRLCRVPAAIAAGAAEALDQNSVWEDKKGLYVPPSPNLRAWAEGGRAKFGSWLEWRRAAGVPDTRFSGLLQKQAVGTDVLGRLARVAGIAPPNAPQLTAGGSGTLRMPEGFTPDLARFLGLLIAEGRNTSAGQVWFVNSDPAVNDEFERLAQTLFDVPVCRRQYKPVATDSLIFSRALCEVLERVFGFAVGSGSFEKQAPPHVFAADEETQWAFLSGLFEGDAHVSVRPSCGGKKTLAYIEYVSASETLARQVVALMLRLGLFAQIRPVQKYAANTAQKRRRMYWSVLVHGNKALRHAAARLRFVGAKQQKLNALRALDRESNPNHDLVPGATALVRAAARMAGVKVKANRAGRPKLAAYYEQRCEASRAGLAEVAAQIRELGKGQAAEDLLSVLDTLAASDVYWDEVTQVEPVTPPDPWVYDLCVPETHNFVAGNVVVHNSNVADSLTWVLGEQKASSLRATRAQDVIFAGAARRKPMGMAEVSLTVDNEDGFLPLPFAEVTITRRVYRNGEGEYLLNKVPCRLRDIQDLFTDTGVGRGAYAIVNQSEIDQVLSAHAADRRALFEEAAGIKKYRNKKREAERKLENVETNLLRVRDIAHEVNGQLPGLERQAGVARRHGELSTRLREIEVGLLAADYKRLTDELRELARVARTAGDEADALRAEAADAEQTARELGHRITEAEAEMDRGRLLEQSALAGAERAEGQIALSRERKEAAERDRENLQHDLQTLESERARVEAEAQSHRAVLRDADERTRTLGEQLQAAERAAADAERALGDVARTLAGQQQSEIEFARKLATQRADLAALRARLAARDGEIVEAEKRATARQAEAEAARTEAAALVETGARTRAAEQHARDGLENVHEPARKQADAALAQAGQQRQATERRVADQSARLRVLQETEAAQEGYFAGVRAVMSAAKNGQLSGRFSLVADALRVPAELDTAVEIALGASLQDIITNTEAEAKAAIRLLRDTRGGRATFLPLDALRRQEVPGSLRQAGQKFAGVRGSLADLVDFDADAAPAVHVLLARVLVADDVDTATRVARQIDGWGKIVTLAGEVVVPSGAITGGTQAKSGPNLLGRKREIADLNEAVRRGRADAARFAQNEESARADLAGARDAVQNAEREIAQAREQARDAEKSALARQTEADRLGREADALAARAQSLAQAQAGDRAREQTVSKALSEAGEQGAGAQATRDDLQERQLVLSEQRAEAAARSRALAAELATLRERALAARRDAERAQQSATRTAQSAHERTRRASEAAAIIAAEDARLQERLLERDRARTAQIEAHALLERWRGVRQQLLADNFALADAIKTAERGAREADERAQNARLRAARLETQAEAVAQRLMDEYELEPDRAIALTGGAPPVDQGMQTEINRLRREIKTLGSVNPAAVEEYEQLSERARFLTEQQADLAQSKATLSAAIAEIDQATRGLFDETFRAVGRAFSLLFARLFSGGSAELVLSDPDDLLETGVDIVAQPPGKKRQSLSLLSGGERALTAAALLFAFLQVKPAPFCVLDEVDAPLDGANVEKFGDLLREFGRTMQFIVITHNATTMEAAPLWQGITMQEPGVSRGLSLRVPASTSSDQSDDQ